MKPRVLVTGFGAFPGTPVNPTEALVAELEARKGEFTDRCELATALFDVDYRALPARLEGLASPLSPDIAIHFGLSAQAAGFQLERLAKNEIRPNSPDNAGFIPGRGTICDLDESFGSTLPLEAIHAALTAKGLPVAYSDDAGGYLCNFLFYHARSGLCSAFTPHMAGFIHVPPLRSLMTPNGLTLDQLVDGARTIIAVSVDRWQVETGEAA
ncbi:MAG TPA: pyroglutamyl-peptidase I [Rhizobiaceae bacterium]|nr:pyroglutamyl-peptidase I [Rhizobiaceae bacterium]